MTEPISGGLCIDFGGSTIKAAIVRGGTLESPKSAEVIDGAELDAAEKLVAKLLDAFPCRLVWICVAVPGVVDHRNHLMISAHEKYSSFEGVNLKEWFTSRWNVPFAIENDARAALLGETTSGVARGLTNAVGIVFGTGIGTAALVNGELLRGHTGHGGILGGHMTVDINAGDCPCGNRGCAEFLASGWILRNSALFEKAHASSGGIEALVEDARANDPTAVTILDKFVTVWGATIVGLCHIFDPEAVVIAGGPMRSSDLIFPLLSDYVNKHVWPSLATPQLLVPTEPDLSVLRGLASMSADLQDGGPQW